MDKKIWGVIGGIALVFALLSPFVLGSTKKVERIFEDAEGCYERAEYADAFKKYNKSLKESKKYGVKTEIIDQDFAVRVNYRIGRCLKELDKNNEALEYYRFVIVEFPASQYTTHSYIDSGDIYYDRNDYEAASEEYKRALETTADEEWRNQIYQKYRQALLYIQNPPSLELIETPDFAALTEATSLRFDRRFEEAATQYNAFASNYLPAETAVYALYWAGRCYHKADLFQQSADAFEKLIDDYAYTPNTIEAYHGLAVVYFDWAKRDQDTYRCRLVIQTIENAKQEYADSRAALDQEVLSLMETIKRQVEEYRVDNPCPPEPPSEEVVTNQGREHLDRGELELAEEKARAALHINATYPPACQLLAEIKKNYCNQGREHLDRGELELAKEKARAALRIDRTYPPANQLLRSIQNTEHYVRGLMFLDDNQYDAARDEFQEVISVNPNCKEAYFNLGVVYFNLHNYIYAEDAVNKALAIDRDYEEAQRLLNAIIETRRRNQ